MYQIFVVEDEMLIRQNIRNTVEKMQGPYSFCGEASDGEMALSMMQDLMPDILLTDIRMPFLDGFGLIEHAKTIMPWLKVVVITGFGDIESAQKAISLGVDQYLLKPVRSQDLIEVIEKMAQQIEADKNRSSISGEFDTDEVKVALRKHFMQQLLYGGTDTADLLEQARKLKYDIVRSYYQVIVFCFDIPEINHKMLRDAVERLIYGRKQLMYFFSGMDQLSVLVFDNDIEHMDEYVYQFINIVKHELNEICPVITVVIGNKVRRLGEICDSHRSAVILFKKISGVSAGRIISTDDAASITVDIVQFNGPFGSDLYHKIKYAETDSPEEILESILAELDREQFGSTLIRYNALIQLLKVVVHIMSTETDGGNEQNFVDGFVRDHNVFAASGNYQDFKRTAEDLIQIVVENQPDKNEIKNNHVITLAEKYVEENFCDPNISLISVARYVGMSPAHFSTVFSQQQGRTFINYLTHLRIKYAKELLTSTNMKLADIALKIGYNEPNYFSHVFRKSEGITPKEFRSESTHE